MSIPEKDRKARANYRKKVQVVRIELYGTDEDIKGHLNALKENGVSVQGYLKDLIRDDMQKNEKNIPN